MSRKGCPNKEYSRYCRYGHDKQLVGQNSQRACKMCAKLRSRKDCLMHEYGLTLEQWQQMFDEQSGCCLLCGKHQSELKRILQVDHDHITGKVRGLLCSPCNVQLGWLENKEFCAKASIYLARSK